MAPKTVNKRKSGSKARKATTQSAKAGTIMPVARLNRMIKSGRYA